jgi:hypothetical protein
LALGKLVAAVYDNPLKKDYLLDSPFQEYILAGDRPDNVVDNILKELQAKQFEQHREKGAQWAKEQTWAKITDLYERLWR